VKTKIPFEPDGPEHFHRWRKYYRYCAGLLGDLVPHRLHPLMLASGNPEFPTRVTCISSKNVDEDKEAQTPERETSEHMQLIAQFPSGYMVTIVCSTVNAKSPGFAIYGHKATMNIGNSGDRIELVPEKDFAEEIIPTRSPALSPKTRAFTKRTGSSAFGRRKCPMRTSTSRFGCRR